MVSSAAVCSAFLLVPAVFAILQGQGQPPRKTGSGGRDNGEQTARSADEKDVYEAQASYEHPHYYHGDHGYGHGYHHHHVSYVNDEAVKGLLVPLVGIAFLGAAALAAANPVLLQIGVIGGSVGKRRKRRAVPRFEDLRVLEKFLEQIPKPQVMAQEKKLQASYLQCSGIADKSNHCFERITCEFGKPNGNSTSFEKQVLDIVISDIMRNEYLPTEMKHRIHQAQKIGLSYGDCSKFYCKEIESRYTY